MPKSYGGERMKRTKQWWAKLTIEERATLVYLERGANLSGGMGGGGYLPDNCSECGACGNPMCGYGGLCSWCQSQLDGIISKADNEVE